MKPTEEQIKNHEKNYKKSREDEWRDGVQMYINKTIASRQQEMSDRGLKHHTWRWTYETHKAGMVIFKKLGLKYKVYWKGELKNWGLRQTVENYVCYLLAKII